jgi:hypothetical protein
MKQLAASDDFKKAKALNQQEPVAYQIRDLAAAANWAEDNKHWLIARAAGNVANAAQIIEAAKPLPDALRALVLRNRDLTTGAQIVAAMKDAAHMYGVCVVVKHPELAAEYIKSGPPIAQFHIDLTNKLAEGDQHIDTARRPDAADASFNAMADEIWARKNAATQKAATQKAATQKAATQKGGKK